MKGYQLNLGSRPVVTLCGHDRDFATLVAAMDASTLKRRTLRQGLLFAARLRLVPLIGTALTRDAQSELEAMTKPLHTAAAGQGSRVRSLSVQWPAGDRTHRRYVLGVDQEGSLRFFSKVTVDPALDGQLLDNEGQLLTTLAGDPLPHVRTPRLFHTERTDDLGALVMEALPTQRDHVDWAGIQSLLPLREPQSHRPHAPAWVAKALEEDMSATFTAVVTRGLPKLRTGLVNGDVRPSNVVVSAGQIWLFDWEYGAHDAPASTDLAAALLNAKTSGAVPTQAPEVLVRWLGDVEGAGIAQPEAALCLLYLSTVDHPWAKLLMTQEWPLAPILPKDASS